MRPSGQSHGVERYGASLLLVNVVDGGDSGAITTQKWVSLTKTGRGSPAPEVASLATIFRRSR